jgi:hypothetical protein
MATERTESAHVRRCRHGDTWCVLGTMADRYEQADRENAEAFDRIGEEL